MRCVTLSVRMPCTAGNADASLAALGTWDMRVCVLALPSLAVVAEQPAKDVIPRSVLLANCDGCCYLLCGMGDGSLLTHSIDATTGSLADRKSVVLGTKPINLSFFTSMGARHIFAASDRPTVLYSAKGKLLYANLNEHEVHFLASFNSAAFPDSLAIAKEGMLTIGGIDAVQKLHIQTVPLGEMPRRIAHQPATKTFAVLMSSSTTGALLDGCTRPTHIMPHTHIMPCCVPCVPCVPVCLCALCACVPYTMSPTQCQ